MNRPICVISIIYIIVIIGLHYNGVVFLEYNKVDKVINNNKNELIGTIIDEKEEKSYKYVYIIKIESNNKILNGKKFILNFKKNNNISKLSYGDKIKFYGEIIKINGKRNYGGFDYSLYLKTQKIYGSFEINNYTVISKNNNNFINNKINDFKQYIKNILNKYLKRNEADLCIGLLIGDRENILEDIEDDFKKSNLTHMLAVSGSHFVYIILGLTYIEKIIKRKRFVKILTIICIVMFMNLTGNTASVVRSGIMSLIIIISSFLHRKSDIFVSLSIAIIIQLIDNPYVIFDIGLQLSYGGVIGIVLFNEGIYKSLIKLLENLSYKK